MTEDKLLSVVIPTYKRKFDLIERAIKSIENQTYKNVQILVIDDNRDDGQEYTQQLIEGLQKHPNIIYDKTVGKHGAQVARNKGISISKGDYLAFLDDDDYWDSTLAEKEIALLEKNPNAGMAYCKGYNVYENTNPQVITDYFTSGENFKTKYTFSDMIVYDRVGTTTQAIIRRNVLEDVGTFDEEFPARQDYEMWIRISKKYDLVGVDEKLFYHNLHGGTQISKSHHNAIGGYKALLKKYDADYKKNPSGKRYLCKKLAEVLKSDNDKEWIKYKMLAAFCVVKILAKRISKN